MNAPTGIPQGGQCPAISVYPARLKNRVLCLC